MERCYSQSLEQGTLANLAEEFVSRLRTTLPDAQIEHDTTPSGYHFVTIRVDSRVLVAELTPRGEFGLTQLEPDTNPFVGADEVFTSVEDLFERVRTLAS